MDSLCLVLCGRNGGIQVSVNLEDVSEASAVKVVGDILAVKVDPGDI